MIYLISDLHGDINHKGLNNYLNTATDGDLLIILGDIGLEFEKTKENREFTKRFLSIDKSIAFIDGNHDNFAYLDAFPEEDWNGGRIHRLSKSIVHLIRGNVYTLSGNKLFVFGGCKSSAKWKEAGLYFEGEEATEKQLSIAYANIEKHDFKLDYILTHKHETEPVVDNTDIHLLELCKFIEEKVEYRKWYSGHWHCDSENDSKRPVVYQKLTPLL